MVECHSPHSYDACLRLLEARLRAEPGHLQLLAGPRQVGKTTLLLALAETLGAEGAVYVAADAPEASVPGFWPQLWESCARRAQARGHLVLMIDEVQHLPGWASQVKGQIDGLKRRRIPLQLVASGSSALQLGAGTRESLAGRFERLTLSHWSARSLAAAFAMKPEEAAALVVTHGGYPGGMSLRHDLPRWRAYLRDAIIEPAIGRDILALGDIRKPALLRQLFSAAVAAPAQIVSLQKLQGQLQDRGALETLAHYLQLLQAAHLVSGLHKFSATSGRRRAAPPKLVVLNNGLLTVMNGVDPTSLLSDTRHLGPWLENACLAHAHACDQEVFYWRQEPFEVDAVIRGSWGAWAIEVKSGSYTPGDLGGLLKFTAQNPTYRPLVLCRPEDTNVARRVGVNAMGWPEFLWGPTFENLLF